MLLVAGHFKLLFDLFLAENLKTQMGTHNVKEIINCLLVNMSLNYVYCFLFRHML